MLKDFLKDESGQDLVEYALVVGVVALGAIAGLNSAATNINGMWTKLNTAITNASAKIT